MASGPPVFDLSTIDALCQRNPLREDCSNGIDDNGDCRIDCEDDDCQRSDDCKVTSYGALQTMAGSAALTCAAGSQAVGPLLYQGIDSDQKGCTGCECNSPACTIPKVSAFAAAGCMGAATQSYANLATNSCLVMNPVPTGSFFAIDAPAQACTTKTASGQPTPAYQQSGRLCQTSGTPTCEWLDCLNAKPDIKLCVAFATNPKYCPAPFAKRVTDWQTAYSDPRTCACSCRAPAAPCAGKVTVFGAADCTSPATVAAVDLNAACTGNVLFNTTTMMPTPGVALRSTFAPAVGNACTAATAVMGASPTLSNPTVLCCQP